MWSIIITLEVPAFFEDGWIRKKKNIFFDRKRPYGIQPPSENGNGNGTSMSYGFRFGDEGHPNHLIFWCLVIGSLLLMAEILHQLIGRLSQYF